MKFMRLSSISAIVLCVAMAASAGVADVNSEPGAQPSSVASPPDRPGDMVSSPSAGITLVLYGVQRMSEPLGASAATVAETPAPPTIYASLPSPFFCRSHTAHRKPALTTSPSVHQDLSPNCPPTPPGDRVAREPNPRGALLMINVDKTIFVNQGLAPGEPKLTRGQVWKGLELKADNALPFVAAMTQCKVLERTADGFVREIVLRGETMQERITFTPQKQVKFERLTGSKLGTILNEILDDAARGLGLRFAFSIEPVGVAAGSVEEKEFRQVMERDYLTAVQTTLDAIRRMVKEGRLAA